MQAIFVILITFFSCAVSLIVIYNVYKLWLDCNEIQRRIYPETKINNREVSVELVRINKFPE